VKKYYFDTVKADKPLSEICAQELLIQYIGSELEAKDHPHGNSASSSTPYIRTYHSVIEDSDQSEFPSAFYKKETLSAAK